MTPDGRAGYLGRVPAARLVSYSAPYAKHALKLALSSALGTALTLPAPYAGQACPVRTERKRFSRGDMAYAYLGVAVETPTVVGKEILQQIDCFSRDANGTLANVVAGRVEAVLRDRARGAGGFLPAVAYGGQSYLFPLVGFDLSLNREEKDAEGDDVWHVILQIRVRVQAT